MLNRRNGVGNHARKIDDIKSQVKHLIQENINREVTPDTKHKISGVYMIYINDFTNDYIVPIYIGQAKDIQKRYSEHLKQILALNRLSYDEYEEYFFSNSRSYYDGKFKACKIFKYMLENNCTLHDFHMIILEEIAIEHLEEKEQEYFQQLLPSFFGFNQLNSRTEYPKLGQLSSSKINKYLSVLQEDIDGITSYYSYGFTRFNFEHAFPKDHSFLLKEKNLLSDDILLKYEEVKCNIEELLKRYKLDFEKNEIQRLNEQVKKTQEEYSIARDECDEAVARLENEVIKKFKKLHIYSGKKPITNFIYSIFLKEESEKPKYQKLFYKFLESKNCDIDFYEMFNKQIHEVNDTFKEKANKSKLDDEAYEAQAQKLNENTYNRYKMIFPSIRFTSFPLGDRFNPNTIDIRVDDKVFNTCHFQIFISNNGRCRSEDISKEPYIIRFDYCYIDKEGNKSSKQYYIDNAFTKDCQAGIQYVELDFNRQFAFTKSPFNISRVVDGWYDNTIISIAAEYNHGMNDYTINDKNLISLEEVLDEIQQLTNEGTRFSIDATESHNCLERCILNEELHSHMFGEKLIAKTLPKIKKSRKTSTKGPKKIEDKS